MVCYQLFLCVIGLSFSISIQCVEQQPNRHNRIQQDDLSKFYDTGKGRSMVERISRRAVSQATAKGLFAIQKLLGGARKVKTPSDIFRRYEKVGNEDSALEDFYSVDPSYVKFDFGSLRNGRALVGQAGDRRIILRERGDKLSHGRPVIEIGSSTNNIFIYKIVYKPKQSE